MSAPTTDHDDARAGIVLTAGDSPPRLVRLGDGGVVLGTCACCRRERDVVRLQTFRATGRLDIHPPAGGPTAMLRPLQPDPGSEIGEVDVCGMCIAGALAVRFAAAQQIVREHADLGDGR